MSVRRIEAGSRIHHLHKEELCALVERHGEKRNDVNWVEYDVLDCPLLRMGVFLRRDGRLYLDCDKGRPHDDHSCRIAMETREHALIGSLPEWWRP